MSHFRFLDLPYTIREQIYQELLTRSEYKRPSLRIGTSIKNQRNAILRTNRQIYEESRPILYTCNLFVLVESNNNPLLKAVLQQYQHKFLKNEAVQSSVFEDKIAMTLSIFFFSPGCSSGTVRPRLLFPRSCLPYFFYKLRQPTCQAFTTAASLTLKINNRFHYTQDRIAELMLKPFKETEPLNFLAVMVDDSIASHHTELRRKCVGSFPVDHLLSHFEYIETNYEQPQQRWQVTISYCRLLWACHERLFRMIPGRDHIHSLWCRTARAYYRLSLEYCQESERARNPASPATSVVDESLQDLGGASLQRPQHQHVSALRDALSAAREQLEDGIKFLRSRDSFARPERAMNYMKAEVLKMKIALMKNAAWLSQNLDDRVAAIGYGWQACNVEGSDIGWEWRLYEEETRNRRDRGELTQGSEPHEIVTWDD